MDNAELVNAGEQSGGDNPFVKAWNQAGGGANAPEPEKEADESVFESGEDDISADDSETEEPKYKVVVDGREMELPLSQLLENAQKGIDYTQKTQALSEQRKMYDEGFRTIQSKMSEVDALFGVLTEITQAPMMPEQELLQLALTDPAKAQQIEIKQRLQQKQIEQVRQHQLAIKQQQQAIALQYGQQYLKANAPHLLDQSVQTEIANYLLASGYSRDEVGQVYDPRALIVAEKARKYDELMKKREQVQKGIKPAGEKVLQPNGQAAKPLQRKVAIEERQRLRKSGDVRDAAAVFNRILKS